MSISIEKEIEKELARELKRYDRELQAYYKRQDKLVFKDQAKINRMIRMDSAFISEVVRKDIFKRDGYTCQLCNRRLDMTVSVPHSMAATIDHIIPISKGGTHEPANVQAAHFVCNSQKGNGSFSIKNIRHHFKKK